MKKVLMSICLMVVSSAHADSVLVEKNILAEAKYYVRTEFLTPKVLAKVGLSEAPGGADDEGYCQIQASAVHQMPIADYTKPIVLKKGEVLNVIGEEKRYSHYLINEEASTVTLARDVYTTLAKNDGTKIYLACSIDSNASERYPYKPVSDVFTKAYLAALGLIVKN